MKHRRLATPAAHVGRYALACSAAVLLSACSSGELVQSDTIDYKSARKAPTLEVPPDLVSPGQDERYAIPGESTTTYSAWQGGQRIARAGSNSVLKEVDNMRIERLGNQRWLLVNGNAEKLWPEIKMFWEQLGFVLATDRPDIGMMETDWAEDRAKIPQDFIRKTIGKVFDSVFSTGTRDRFRTRLETGRQPGSIEIYITHRGMEEVYRDKNKDSTIWQPRTPDPALESEMLRRLMVYLGADAQRAGQQLQASAAGSGEQGAVSAAASGGSASARLLLDDSQMPHIALNEAFDRAWRSVGLALDHAGFTVEDRDRSQGLYFVRYIDSDRSNEKKGFFSSLAFWRSKDKTLNEEAQYRIALGASGNSAQIHVQDNNGQPDRSETARRILTLLHEALRGES